MLSYTEIPEEIENIYVDTKTMSVQIFTFLKDSGKEISIERSENAYDFTSQYTIRLHLVTHKDVI